MIYFDNSATTYPKPDGVRKAVYDAVLSYGGNPGRGGHEVSLKAAEMVYRVRKKASDFFGAKVENTVFTVNCTHALNMAIKGVVGVGDHVIFSSLEHNSVSRPIYALTKSRGVKFSVAEIDADDNITIENFKKLIRADTKVIVCTVASNVTGQIVPYKKIAELCRQYGLCYIADAAQASGIIDIKLSDGFNFICTAGHKGLYGPTGTGLLVTDGTYPLATIIEGGNGATSSELEQTAFLPERLESGTLNTVGIMGLGAGISFVESKGVTHIYNGETKLCEIFIREIEKIDGIRIFRNENASYVPIVSFNFENTDSGDVTEYLNENGFALRGGLQCAAVTHHFLGTVKTGAVRFSPSAFNTEKQTLLLANTLKKFRKVYKST